MVCISVDETTFLLQYLATPESQSLRCDLIRFIVGVIHPTNELLCSDIIPRWAVIGWLLTTCTSSVAASNAKLALFYDWLFFEADKDNIMNIGQYQFTCVLTDASHQFTVILIDMYHQCACFFNRHLPPICLVYRDFLPVSLCFNMGCMGDDEICALHAMHPMYVGCDERCSQTLHYLYMYSSCHCTGWSS
jgi:Conserved protein (DUF2356).